MLDLLLFYEMNFSHWHFWQEHLSFTYFDYNIFEIEIIFQLSLCNCLMTISLVWHFFLIDILRFQLRWLWFNWIEFFFFYQFHFSTRKGIASQSFAIVSWLKIYMVHSLLGVDGIWNEDLIRCNFLLDVEVILKMRPGHEFSKDEIIWNYGPKGWFSVKSAYYLTIFLSTLKEASSSIENLETSVWKLIWKVKTLRKVKQYVWRVIQDIIPKNVNIAKKGINTNPLCLFCKKDWEFTSHVLWNCKLAKIIWLKYILNMQPLFVVYRVDWHPLEFWVDGQKSLRRSSAIRIFTILWCLLCYKIFVKSYLSKASLEHMQRKVDLFVDMYSPVQVSEFRSP